MYVSQEDIAQVSEYWTDLCFSRFRLKGVVL